MNAHAVAAAGLPSIEAWQAAALRHADLFDALDPGARVALVARATPDAMLLWEACEQGIRARIAPFTRYADSGADIALAADAEALAAIHSATSESMFEVLRAGIREGSIVCYMLRRRCHLEERGFDELLEALGFVFMGACR
jgi:hypothetical protein